jgi:preprotein translocase subunit SecY
VGNVLQLLRIPETRKKVLNTLGLLMAYRVGFQIPIPGVSPDVVADATGAAGTQLFGLLSAFTGANLSQTVIFALGIMPYISASIIFSVLGKVSPQIEAVQKEGAAGYKKINQWTRLSTIPIALLQGIFIWFGVFRKFPGMLVEGESEFKLMLSVILSLTAGAILVMWIGELITEYGIGNGASLIIMAGIIATMPASIGQIVVGQPQDWWNVVLKLLGIWIAIVLVIVFIQKGERRIPIQYARLTRGRRVYGGQRHYLPLKVNMAGVMPIIFASALFIVPGVINEVFGWDWLEDILRDADGFIYITANLLLVFGFCFFWNNLMFRPEEIADNLREHGSFIPGIRPGGRTADFLKGTLTRITLAGAVFLSVIAVLPNFITANIPSLTGNLAYFLGGTSVLIVVGVAMDVVDKLNAQLVMRNYEGFMKSSAGPGSWAKKGS